MNLKRKKRIIRNLLCFLALSLVINPGKSQDTLYPNAIHLKGKLLDEFSLSYERRLSRSFFASLDVGFNTGGATGVQTAQSIIPLVRHIRHQNADRGPVCGLSINYVNKTNVILALDVFYRDLFSENLVYDPGRFGGSNTSEYREFDQRSRELGFLLSIACAYSTPARFKIGIGVQNLFLETTSLISGTYDNQRPSSGRSSSSYKLRPILKIDMLLRAVKF